jgi:hypothetical protein
LKGQSFRQVAWVLLACGVGVLAVALLATTLSGAHARAAMLCVKPGGGDGCLASINAALAVAGDEDTIQVAAGTYVENVLISRTLTLQGGWSPDFSVRDLGAFSSTIVPADNTQSVVSIHGRFIDPSAVAPTLDGFVITGGRADLGSNHGGGLRIVDSNAVVISNTIKDNVAFYLGGGVWVQRGAPTLQGNHIISNTSVGLGQDAHGGGVQLENTQATLMDNLIANNVISGTVGFGGGIEIVGTGAGQVVLRRNQFISNTASLKPGIPGYGGAIAVSSGQVRLEDSSLISNVAGSGGGIFVGGFSTGCCDLSGSNNLIRSNTANGLAPQNGLGGGIFISGTTDDCCAFRGTNTHIQGNTAAKGGGLYNGDQSASLRDTRIISNAARVDGGGLFISAGGAISLTNSAAIDNLAAQDGGAIHNSGLISISNTTISGNQADGMGGGIANFDVVDLLNATVSNNTSGNGAGLFSANIVNTRNSLIALNVGDNCLGAMNSLGHNLEDGFTCALDQPTDMPNTPASMDPLGDNGGATPTHALAGDSPAIDAGDNGACASVDQRGVPRPIDGDGDGQAECDIGAFEYQVLTTSAILSDAPDPSQPGEPFTVSFAVMATLGLPTGTVTVSVSDDPGSCNGMLAGGMGSCGLTLSVPGIYTLTAAYVSAGTFAPSSAFEAHTVKAPGARVYLPLVIR